MKFFRVDRRFWWVLLAAMVSASLTASLGFWQLRRAALKESVQSTLDQRMAMPILSNADLASLDSTASVLHRSATLKGQWLPHATVFLDNRQMNQRQGFYVVTPFKLADDGRLLLVQRGWVPRDFQDRTRVPRISSPAGWVEVSGRMAAAPARVYELGPSDSGLIRQNLSVAAVAQDLAAEVIDGSLVQLTPSPHAPDDGLVRQWPQVASDVHKHHGYAFQWFGLCALIVVLYVWFQIISPLRQRRGATA